MDREIKRIKLYVKDTPNANNLKVYIEELLKKNNFEIVDYSYDLAISIGGDGTFLKMLHANNFNNDIYYASINAGSLGYLSSVSSDEIEKFVNNIKKNSCVLKEMSTLKAQVYKNNEIIDSISLNELTIRKTNFSTLRLDVLVNNQFLENFNGDGLVISTSTGSTGYNEALGGCIIDNDMKALIITPIAPINNKVYKSLTNSLVLSDKNTITLIPKNRDNLCFLRDGVINNISFDKIVCSIQNNGIKCLMTKDYNYINNIRTKMIDNE